MTDITLPQAAGAILDGVARRVIPLSHAELIAVNRECTRLRQKPVQRRMTHKREYKAQPVGRLTGALWGLYGLVLVMWEGVTGW